MALGGNANLEEVGLGGSNSYLTKREEDAVLQWIRDSQCEKQCPESIEGREFAKVCGSSGSTMADHANAHDGTVSSPGIPNSGRSLRMAWRTRGVKSREETCSLISRK
jgi:hypothetical protein